MARRESGTALTGHPGCLLPPEQAACYGRVFVVAGAFPRDGIVSVVRRLRVLNAMRDASVRIATSLSSIWIPVSVADSAEDSLIQERWYCLYRALQCCSVSCIKIFLCFLLHCGAGTCGFSESTFI